MKSQLKIRNPYALAAMMRNSGGPMKDRRTPRGGNKNKQNIYLQEYEDIKDSNDCKEGRNIMEQNDKTKVQDEKNKIPSNVRISYAIFPTPFGKGYGCFAIRREEDGSFSVSPSYCNPVDRAKFSKPKARLTAVARLNSAKFTGNVKIAVPEVKEGEKAIEPSLEDVIAEYLRIYSSPSWARKSFDVGLWRFTLKYDNYDFDGYVDLLMNEAGSDTTQVAMGLIAWTRRGSLFW